jgi:quercetin dioxygenase-like cupin family protein
MQTKDMRLMSVRTERRDLVTLLATGEETEGRFAILEMVASRPDQTPLHSHSQEDELVCVVQGEVTFYLDGKRLECPAGTCVFLPKGSAHTHSIESAEAKLLVLVMPAGLEGYYLDLDGMANTEQNVDRLITVSARYGVNILGPGPPDGASGSQRPVGNQENKTPASREPPTSEQHLDG